MKFTHCATMGYMCPVYNNINQNRDSYSIITKTELNPKHADFYFLKKTDFLGAGHAKTNTCTVKIAQRSQGGTHWFLTTEGLPNTKTPKNAVCTTMHSIPMLTIRLISENAHVLHWTGHIFCI